MKRLLLVLSLVIPLAGAAQLHWVDPFIGTTVSAVDTRWGNEGGVYPGAVAVSGFIQLTPETRGGGYDYRDNHILRFSCTGHYSGFPGGSAGHFYVMVGGAHPFAHRDEVASPGYYRVRFSDDSTLVEAVATPRTGMFRFIFRKGTQPRIYIGDTSDAAYLFSQPCVSREPAQEGVVLTFAPTDTLLLRVSVSTAGPESARRNIAVEGSDNFDTLRHRTQAAWTKALGALQIEGTDKKHDRIFYTALYHSLLLPWIISDVDGWYRGADGKLHRSATTEYGGFSPWDTFRTLHPLLALFFPQKESDIVRSMLDVYRQRGYLPTESMTGNHAIPIIVDAIVKGVPCIDTALAYEAMAKSIVKGPFLQNDMAIYRRLGYIPFDYPESVSRTLEYAYDDACLARLPGPYREMLDSSSRAYRRLFDPVSLLLLPRKGDSVLRSAGNAGYKEGDAWGYSYFVPQDPAGLINYLGQGPLFAARLDSILSAGLIPFDNETVLQIPYLFSVAGYPDLTAKWVRRIMETRYQDKPGGLPGNDDLGAMSSWYVWSAIGFYPFCPGKPDYVVGSPLVKTVRALHLPAGKPSEKAPHITLHYLRIPKTVTAGVPFTLPFTLSNTGSDGTLQVLGVKNCFVPSGAVLRDSVTCTLYRDSGGIRVVPPAGPLPDTAAVLEATVPPLVRVGDSVWIRVRVQYRGWITRTVSLIGHPLRLHPGEERTVDLALPPMSPGMHTVLGRPVKVYRTALETSVPDLGNDGLGKTLTMMIWVFPKEPDHEGLMDIFTKGDFNVLQVSGRSSLTFFAGGWGRGDCTVDLPADWVGHWHHIAGVCGPDGLRVYIDGRLKGFTALQEVSLSFTGSPWMIGRNAEFPGERVFEGLVASPELFQAALDSTTITSIYQTENHRP
ncbi:GH92 family glycosyl hydrolase [Dinghuibacter silviterrae]|uniref:Putative alpha-1,2-mannosidase n=1 Tax=Dinghuibacter silviterrae TaxID=1539049 RepID=A0A4R8DIU1_9BACT|nr:GH92 family glycosyl hydrolase [Dinghuibacter silviterrae]TDW97428.1 putative alpha-1,2-mannosidase [Dinghuibacter silviterrae]